MAKYAVKYTPEYDEAFQNLPYKAQIAVNKAIEFLAEFPRNDLSVPFGDDEDVRVVDATPYVRLRYVIKDSVLLIILFELTDFRPPLLGEE
jgi:hypothetical protein